MHKVSVDEMLIGRQSRYALVIGVAKRAREIANEFHKEGKIINTKPVLLAVEDFKNSKYDIYEPEIND